MSGVFSYANPPIIRWGPGAVAALGSELDRLSAVRVAIVTTRSVAADERVIVRVREALGGRDPVAMALVGQHAPTADIAMAERMAVDCGADSVVSVGGGSPIDAAKIVAIRAGERRDSERPLPHVAVPTTLSVAELASGAGMTDEAGNKVGLRDPRGLPEAVLYDADLALHTPIELWLSTGIRALDHAVEGFLAEGEHPFADVMSVESARRLFRTLPQAKSDPSEVAVRTENQLAAWFSYTLPGPTAAGLSHMMGKQIGARHGIPHGVTSCLLLPHVMRYRAKWQGGRLAEFASAVGSGRTAADAADAVEQLVKRLGLPQHTTKFGIGTRELRAAAEALARTIGGRHTAEDLFRVYAAAM
jgi:maleylacetate reductase